MLLVYGGIAAVVFVVLYGLSYLIFGPPPPTPAATIPTGKFSQDAKVHPVKPFREGSSPFVTKPSRSLFLFLLLLVYAIVVF